MSADLPGPAATVDRWLARYAVQRPPVSDAGAAVTLVLREGLEDVEVLMIERTVRPTDPASGQVALPGGHVDDGDGNLADTAARELEEEVGLALQDLRGELRYVATEAAVRFGIRVAVFAAALGPAGRGASVHDPAEVAHVFWLPRGALDATAAVERETSRGLRPVPATVFDGHVVWGFTRKVLRGFFDLPEEDVTGGPVSARPPEPPASGAPAPGENRA